MEQLISVIFHLSLSFHFSQERDAGILGFQLLFVRFTLLGLCFGEELPRPQFFDKFSKHRFGILMKYVRSAVVGWTWSMFGTHTMSKSWPSGQRILGSDI